MSENNNDIKINVTTENVDIFGCLKKSKKYLVLLVVMVLIATFVYSKHGTVENKAKNCVNNYLSAIKKGKDANKYKDISVDDFINVLDYKYLDTKEKTKEKYTLTTTRNDYDNFLKKAYNMSFDDYKKDQRDIYNSLNKSGQGVIYETDNLITVWDGDSYYDQVVLLYDVSLTNKLGTQLFKKIYFTVDNKNPDHKMKITSSDY